MQYFELKMSSNVKKTIDAKMVFQKEFMLRFNMIDDISVGYCDTIDGCELPDIMDKPCAMVTEGLKDYLCDYDEDLELKAYQIFSKDKDPKSFLYYFIKPKVIDCIHRNARLLPNGEYEEIILDKTKLRDEDLFAVSQVNGERLIVSRFLAEQLLVKNFYGIGLIPVKTL